jgi:hypothetical protein
MIILCVCVCVCVCVCLLPTTYYLLPITYVYTYYFLHTTYLPCADRARVRLALITETNRATYAIERLTL